MTGLGASGPGTPVIQPGQQLMFHDGKLYQLAGYASPVINSISINSRNQDHVSLRMPVSKTPEARASTIPNP